jgi:methionyl-tRNA formyltransferase
MSQNPPLKYIFFGSSEMSTYVLDELIKAGLTPSAVVTTSDKPQGRKLVLTPNIVKTFATERGIQVYDFAKLDQAAVDSLKNECADVFIVASYGKIIPEAVLSIPPYKTLNVHPSLLPKYRGASPLQSAMLDDAKDTGVTIMRIDAQMDHGPIVAQKNIHLDEWPPYNMFEEMMAREGGRMLVELLPEWIAGRISETEQDHGAATYSTKFTKEDGEIPFKNGWVVGDEYALFRKIQAFSNWPQTFFFIEREGKKLRIKISAVSFADRKLQIEKVIPEGGREMDWESFARGYLPR